MAYKGRSIPEMNDGPARATEVDASALDTLKAGQGAQVTTRKNADKAAERARANAERRAAASRLSGKHRPRYGSKGEKSVAIDRRQLVVLAVAALAVLVVVGILVSRACSSIDETVRQAEQAGVSTQTPQAVQGESSADPNVLATLSYEGATVTLERQMDGSYAVMAVGQDATNPITLFRVPGEPHTLLLSGRTFIVPENLGGSWDVLLFTWGADSPAEPAKDAEGVTITGAGDIAEATLEGAVLHVTDTSGNTVDIPLD